MTELLAPAGSLEGLKAVITAGADAVYIGGSRFGARAYADNPDEDSLIEGIEFAHLRGKKVYMTVNTLLKENELTGLYDYMLPYYRHGVDAVLVQDFGVLSFLHEHFPDLPLHASTQMTITGPKSANRLKKYGVTRIVPARELSLEELKELKDKTGLEVEIFIHGALCVCYSGQCLYSSMIGGRSGNRGRCAQPCRLLYLMDDTTGYDGKETIVNRKEARHFISPKDLCGIDELPELVGAGMDSLKIEGRMKKPEYAAGVVSIYRKYLDRLKSGKDAAVSRKDHRMLYDLYNRSGFTKGYFHQYNGPEMMAPVKHELTREETEARHSLYDEMHERYMEEPSTVPVTGSVICRTGCPLSLTLRSGKNEISVSGKTVEAASSRPVLKDKIAAQISKFGGTDFSLKELDVDTDNTSFVPIGALNELRREGMAALRRQILYAYERFGEVPPDDTPRGRFADKTTNKKEGKDVLHLSALVSTSAQFEACLTEQSIGTIYIESALLYSEGKNFYSESEALKRAEDFVKRTVEAGKKPAIALAFANRARSREASLLAAAPRFLKMGLSGFLVRNPESLADLKERGLLNKVRADAGLYTFNHKARYALQREGVRCDTAPFELNERELFGRDNTDSEIVVYGRLPLMVTVQCLEKNTRGCTKVNESHVLTDRMGVRFPVQCVCAFCYNKIENSVPLSLATELDAIGRMGFDSVRLQFTTESPDEVRRIVRTLSGNLVNGTKNEIEKAHTKGHFLRGVE